MLRRLRQDRRWLAAASVILIAACLLPPFAGYARRYVFAESLQFALFATAIPALLVLGAPWRLPGGPRPRWLALAARRRPGFGHSATVLAVFVGAVIAWRLPAAVNALATVPGLAVAEMVTLVVAGAALWLELADSPPLLPRLSRPLRAAFAAVAMWTIWILAYILGFSHVAWFHPYAHTGLSAVADQEIATGILWAVPGICFVPVVYVTMMTWLKDTEDPDEGLRTIIARQRPAHGFGRWPRPPRGWDTRAR